MPSFTLTIDGGDGSSAEPGSPVARSLAPEDVADALREIARQLDAYAPTSIYCGPVADSSGRCIGRYHGVGEAGEDA